MNKTFLAVGLLAFAHHSMAAGPALLISEVFVNPNGNDAAKEWVELVATTDIDFALTPFSVVVANNGSATAKGWTEGGNITFGFNLSSGSLKAGDVAYVGGSGMAPTGTKLRVIDVTAQGGDGFGNKQTTAGVFGNGGSNADGIAVFSGLTSSLSASSAPIDALFYGSAIGSARVSSGTAGYQLPVNDLYSGGKLGSNAYLAGDPSADQVLRATGSFDAATGTFSTARSWAVTTVNNNNLSAISVSAVPEPESYALMLAGLGALGLMARRRSVR